jgi:Family of unknown function (DUF6328)
MRGAIIGRTIVVWSLSSQSMMTLEVLSMDNRWSWWTRPAHLQDPAAPSNDAVPATEDEHTGSRGIRPYLAMAPSLADDVDEADETREVDNSHEHDKETAAKPNTNVSTIDRQRNEWAWANIQHLDLPAAHIPFNGINGLNGADGAHEGNGTNGANGANGANGFHEVHEGNGAHGLKGVKGIKGVKGVKGVKGLGGLIEKDTADKHAGETPRQRLDRRYHELLQEVRVAQTAVQILLGFLLTLSFTPRFAILDPVQRNLYIVTLVIGTAATALLTAPAAFHRVVFRDEMKRQLVRAAHRYTVAGFVLLLLAMGCALLLILDVVVGSTSALRITSAVMMWFVLCWIAVPYWFRLRHREQPASSSHAAGGFR